MESMIVALPLEKKEWGGIGRCDELHEYSLNIARRGEWLEVDLIDPESGKIIESFAWSDSHHRWAFNRHPVAEIQKIMLAHQRKQG